MADESANNLKELAERKSRELYEIQEMRIEKLEHALEEKEKQVLQIAEERQAVLKDYQQNLQLLEGRDKQFVQFEAVITEVRSQLHSKNRSISDLKVAIDRQKEKLSLCDAVLDQERKRLQKRLLEQKEQVEAYIRAKEESMEAERKQTEVTRRKYQQRLLEVEADLEAQKTHMLAQFDGMLRQREHEYRCKLDELCSTLESRDLKVSSLSSECASLRAEVTAVRKELDDRTAVLDEEERRRQEIQWRLQEEANMYRGRVAELEVEVKHGADKMVQLLKENEAKVNKLDGICRQKELMLRNAVQAHKETVLSLEEKQNAAEKTVLEKERVIRELHAALKRQEGEAAEEMERQRSLQAAEVDKHRKELSLVQMEVREKEGQVAALERQCDILKMDVQEGRQEVARYKEEIVQYLEKDRAVKQERAQLELNHQMRLEEVERNICQQNETFIKELSSAKEKSEAEVARLRKGLAEAQRRSEEYRLERDAAVKGRVSNERSHGKDDQQKVLQQNHQLRSVIAAMKEEMERLSRPSAAQRSSSPFDAPITKGYVHYLEQEVTRLKLANRLVKSEEPAREVPAGASSHGGGWEGQGEGIVQQALLAAMKTDEALRQQEGPRMLEMTQKIKSLEAALKHTNPDAPATHVNRLKLKLLRASLVIAELVREKEKLASIVRSLVSHLGADNPRLQQSKPQCPAPHSHHTDHQDHAPHPTHCVMREESESERSESSLKLPPSGRLSSGRQERGVQFEEPPPPGEGHGSRTGEEVPAVGGDVCQDVGSEDLREECPVPAGQPRVVAEVGSGGDLDLSVSLSTLQFEDSLRLSRDREEFQSLMNDILTPRT